VLGVCGFRWRLADVRRHVSDGSRSASARTQRLSSRVAYRNLSATAAVRVFDREFRGAVAGSDATPAANPQVAGHVLRYVNRYEAIVSSRSGRRLAFSSVPLLAGAAHSVLSPVDLRLRRSRRGFAPVNPIVRVLVGARLSEGVSVGSAGVRVTMRGADVAGRRMGPSTLVFANVATDTDAEVAPTSTGVELYATLRSRRSPSDLRYAVSLPRGAALAASTGGGAAIVRRGKVLARILPPVAVDAQGTAVPVKLAVARSTVAISVRHRHGNFAYPILVDPQFTTSYNPGSGAWTEQLPLPGDQPNYSSSSPFAISASTGTYYGSPSSWLAWDWTASSSIASPGVTTGVFYNVDVELNDPSDTIYQAGPSLGFSCSSLGGPTLYNTTNAPVADITAEWTGNVPGCSNATPEAMNWIVNGSGTATGDAVSNFGSFLLLVSYSCSTNCPTYSGPTGSEGYGPKNPSETTPRSGCGQWPVNCATGNQYEDQTDLSIPGRGIGLSLTRYYNSLAAGVSGPFGNGWSSSFSDHLAVNRTGGTATLTQANGSTVPFTINGSAFVAPGWVHGSLVQNADGTYTYTLANQTSFHFDSSGRLLSEAGRNGETTSVAYDSKGRLSTITDPAGRTITLTYGKGGTVTQATDSSGRTVSYSYSSGDLTGVTDADAGTWAFGYDKSNRLTSETDPRGHTVTTVYNSSNQVTSQTDGANRTRTWTYGTGETLVKNPDGTETDYQLNGQLLTSVTHGYGSSTPAETYFYYDANDDVADIQDPNGNITSYVYDPSGNLTSVTDPVGRVTRWTYDNLNDVTSVIDPAGVTTTYTYDSRGNLLSVSTPLVGTNQTRTITYTRGDAAHPGDVTAVTDANGKTTSYGYDSYGDITSITDPLGNETTYTYDTIGRRQTMVSPRGNAPGANPASYTTTYTYDPMGRVTGEKDPLGHTQSWSYDGDGNLTSYTDADGNKTSYSYDADNELQTITRPDGTTLQDSYDSAGNLTSQTNGAGQQTIYAYDALEHLLSRTDPLNRKTTYVYDGDGNLISVTDPMGRTTTYSYDAANELTSISYSDGTTPNVKYTYNPDGAVASMTDGTGMTTYSYDSLQRLTSETNGAGQQVSYGYDLNGNATSITYPNGKSVTRAFDSDGRLSSVTDWLGNTTAFGYDADSNLTGITFPSATTNADTYSYNDADQMTGVTMTQGSSTLASLSYIPDNAGLLSSEAQTGLPGPAATSYGYTTLNQLASAGPSNYTYDKADNVTQLDGSTGYTYDVANELTGSPAGTYSYDKLGERTGLTPSGSGTNTYGYDQAGRLISYTPSSGTPTTYTYDGNGLRTTETTGTSTSTFAWDQAAAMPLLLTDGQNSYLYGPDNLPVEQIDSNGNPTYLHHDQLGSIRLTTSESGNPTSTTSYNPYGGVAGTTGTNNTPFGYAAQYTDPATGLQYDRARYYDPSTGQFVTTDALEMLTSEPYAYGLDDPLNVTDPSGLDGIFGTGLGPTIGPQINWAGVGTRIVGFFDGLTSPVFGGTAALRNALGLNGGLDKCSSDYTIARTIGQADVSIEAAAATSGGAWSLLRGRLTGLGVGSAPVAGGVGGFFNWMAELSGHQFMGLAAAVAAPGLVAGGTTWLMGQHFSNSASPPSNCSCS
jgi:RHS repeat-associated protein